MRERIKQACQCEPVPEVQPFDDRALIKPLSGERQTAAGIVIPETTGEKPGEGVVVAVGPGKLNQDGYRVSMNCSVGDTVIYARFAGSEVKVDGENCLLISGCDILGRRVGT